MRVVGCWRQFQCKKQDESAKEKIMPPSMYDMQREKETNVKLKSKSTLYLLDYYNMLGYPVFAALATWPEEGSGTVNQSEGGAAILLQCPSNSKVQQVQNDRCMKVHYLFGKDWCEKEAHGRHVSSCRNLKSRKGGCSSESCTVWTDSTGRSISRERKCRLLFDSLCEQRYINKIGKWFRGFKGGRQCV